MNHSASEWAADRIRRELSDRSMSVRALAAGVKWSVGTTHRRIKGQLPFTVDELEAVATFLELPLTELLRPAQVA